MPKVDPKIITKKNPLKKIDRENLIKIQDKLLQFPGIVAVYIPNKINFSKYANQDEIKNLKKLYDHSTPLRHDINEDRKKRDRNGKRIIQSDELWVISYQA